MTVDDQKRYEEIIKGYKKPQWNYTTPENQGKILQKCSILESVSIGYSNITVMNSSNQ